MNKNHVFKDLSSYIDNQLSQEENQRIEWHLKECRMCAQEFSRLKALSEKLKTWQAPDLGPFFEQEVLERITAQGQERGEVKMKKKTLAILIPSGVLAGVLVFVFGLQVFVNNGFQGRLKDKAGYRDAEKSVRAGEAYSYFGTKGNSGWGRNTGMAYSTKSYYGKQQGAYESEDMAGEELKAPAKVAQSPTGGYAGQGEGSVIVIQPVLPATGEGEKIIRTAAVILEVTEGRDAYRRASEICQEFSGYLASSNFYKDEEGREAGTITMRIPRDKFVACLDKLATLGKVENISSNSQDVSQEYSNLKTQLDTAMIVYNKMLEALQRRQVSIPEAMRLESELTPIRQRIENLKNQVEYLNNAISFTTITLNFHEPKVSVKVLKETKQDIEKGILAAKINAVKFFANQLSFLVVLVVLFFVVLGLGVLVKHFILRLFKRG